MTRLLHSRSKIFFTNPYVVRMEYLMTYQSSDMIEADYRKVTRNAYKLIRGTWGYSALDYEVIKVKDDYEQANPPGAQHFNGMSHQQMIASLFDPDWVNVMRGYICFKHEEDALQFRLTIDARARQVVMWPEKTLFTIHEVVETDES